MNWRLLRSAGLLVCYPGQGNQKSNFVRQESDPRHRLRAAIQDLDQMRALNVLLGLAIALSVLPSSAGALELGPCEPAKAVKIIDTSLGQGKTLQKAMQMMIKAKVFDGSKACITFIRETSMSMRDSYPKAFKSLWLN